MREIIKHDAVSAVVQQKQRTVCVVPPEKAVRRIPWCRKCWCGAVQELNTLLKCCPLPIVETGCDWSPQRIYVFLQNLKPSSSENYWPVYYAFPPSRLCRHSYQNKRYRLELLWFNMWVVTSIITKLYKFKSRRLKCWSKLSSRIIVAMDMEWKVLLAKQTNGHPPLAISNLHFPESSLRRHYSTEQKSIVWSNHAMQYFNWN